MELIINNLIKQYNSNKLGLTDFSIKITSGVLGLLGPNGAGKSTLIKMLVTIVKPTSGDIILNGLDILKFPNEMRKVLGYLPQDFGVYPNLNAYEFLNYLAAMKGIGRNGLKSKIENLLEAVNLIEVAKNPLGSYSGGMKQRIGIAQTLLNDPKVIIFDEPTVGLDPEERLRFRDLISDLAQEKIIILSSHIVSDIESIADEVAVMKNGKLLAKQTQEVLIEKVEGKVFEKNVDKKNIIHFKKEYTVISSYRFQDHFRVRYLDENAPKNKIPVSPTLEDTYLFLTNNQENVAV